MSRSDNKPDYQERMGLLNGPESSDAFSRKCKKYLFLLLSQNWLCSLEGKNIA
jgi:hypothetical protein